MSELAWWFYWIEVIDNFGLLFGLLCILSIGAFVIGLVISGMEEEPKFVSFSVKVALPLFAISALCAVILPSKATLEKMVGLTVAEQVVTSDEIQGLAGKGLSLAHKILDEELESK